MKISIIIIVSFFLNYNALFSQNSSTEIFTGCASDELINKDNALVQLQKTLDKKAYAYFLAKNKSEQRTGQRTASVEYIPVVVHIVHNGGPENISNIQVQTAIADINVKYLASNGNQIQFCLAQRDPMGNATTGITRDQSVYTTETMEVDDTTLKNINRWPPTCYLNIWVIKDILSISMGNGVIGYSSFPSAAGTNTDGIVIEASYFGSSSTNDGVATHEIGHYLGLYHTFQNGCTNNNCLTDGDQVCDTPPDQTTYSSCSPPTNSCNTDANDPSSNNPFTTDVADLGDDYMDYSTLSCYNQFTTGQYNRMQYFLTTVRSSLLGCLSCSTPCLTPVIATITSPNNTQNIITGTSISFSGTVINSTSYQWYITSNNILSTSLNTSYTFNTAGNYWIKFVAISSNPSLCLNGIDSLLIHVTQPIVTSCSGSLQLLNTSDAVELPVSSGAQYYSSNGFTWECWIKLTTPFSSYTSSLLRSIICAVDPVSYEDIYLSFGWTGGLANVPITHLAFRVDGPNSSTGPSSVSCDYIPPGGFILGTWYHVAGTMDYVNHTSKLYLNGVLVDTKTVNSAPITRVIQSQLSWNNALNPSNSSLPLGGNMDEVRIWSKVRTPSEIATYYNQCLSGNEQNLLLYYRCNQSAGSSALDATANINNGTLDNLAAWSTQQPTLVGTNCSIGCTPICPPISTNNDTTICSGISVQLNSTNSFTSYTWTPSIGLNNNQINNPIATPVVTTTYVVSGQTLDTNQQPCISTDSVVIKVVNRISPILNLGNDITLCASATHTFYATPGFYSYHWFDGTTNETNTIYGIGKYWVTVKDSCGGTQSDTVLVTLAPSPVLNIRNDTTLCTNDSLQLSYTPAVFNTYQWSPTLGLNCNTCSTPYAKPTTTTVYYLVASTSDGCSVMDSVIITVANSPTLSITNYTACVGQSITIAPVITGGTPAFVYNWNGGYNGTSYSTTPVADSSYSIFVTDANGCFTPTYTGSITVLPPLSVTANGINTCAADTISVLANVSGGNGNYTYTWMPSNSNHNPLRVLPQGNIIYTVTVSDGCTTINATDTAKVTDIPAPVIVLPNISSGCKPVCINLTNISYNLLSNWQWNYGDGNTSLNQKPNYCYTKAGSYNISLSYTTAAGCVKTVMSDSLITVFPFPNVAFTASTFTTDIFNTDINFYNESSGNTINQWSFGDLSYSNALNPSHIYAAMGNYLVMLVVQNQQGCMDTVIHEVQIKDVFTFYAPNTFTPNEDNFNETFLPVGTGWDNDTFKMSIYDRWGNLILTTTNPYQGWDGKMKGEIAQQDVYVWKVELRDVYHNSHTYSGVISVVK